MLTTWSKSERMYYLILVLFLFILVVGRLLSTSVWIDQERRMAFSKTGPAVSAFAALIAIALVSSTISLSPVIFLPAFVACFYLLKSLFF